jgi:hypothetical protein
MVKIISPNIVRVEPKYYSTLRSFLESSLKDEYQWNTGVLLPGTHNALFVKRGKWVLNINHKSAVLFDKNYKQVLLVEPYRYVLETKYNTYEEIRDRIVLTLTDGSYMDIDPKDLTLTYVISEPPVPFYVPLSLQDVVDKVKIYCKAFEEAMPADLKCHKECHTDC